jgi:transglutaminase-like putative cysteine protease
MEASTEVFQRLKLIRHENLIWLIVAQAVVILPLLLQLPVWLWLVWLGALLWRLSIYAGKLNYPSSVVKFVLSCVSIGGLISTYQGAFGVEAMVGFLVCVFVLKLLELRTRNDALLLLFIGFIGVAVQFLFAQSLWAALYACLSCVVLISAWQTIYLTRQLALREKLKRGAVILLHAMPLMLVMFVIMPRIGPLWQTPLLQGSGQTGFSDSLAPGDISNLVRSEGTAFRVNFDGAQTPDVSEMYWRGLVLDSFDGRAWGLNQEWDRARGYQVENLQSKDLLNYEIIVEPHHYRWLFALAEPVKVISTSLEASITEDGLVSVQDPLSSPLQYNVTSMRPSSFEWPELSLQQRLHFIDLPKGYNPQTVELAKSWVNEGNSPLALIDKALALYQQSFIYTLAPPLLGKNSVDDFLFTSKRGFCEHFASSFAVLMRAAGVPARVVVGYQGGTYNKLEDYWMVTQADAHAWVEVWLEGGGWQRIDPTGAVAPQRIEQGINNALAETERNMLAAGQFDAPLWLTGLRHRLDAANYLWSRWVLSYNADKQSRLLEQLLGGAQPWRVGVAFSVLLMFLLALYVLIVIRPKWRTQRPLLRAVHKFDMTCRQWQMQRDPEETLAVFALRLAEKQPQLKPACNLLAVISQQTLYADDDRGKEKLIKALRRFPQSRP